MKLIHSPQVSAFGGINFVLEHFDELKIGELCDKHLPSLANQSKYSWKDLFYSLCCISYCGADCMEDLNQHLKGHFKNNPFVRLASADTMLRRLGGLADPARTCMAKRGKVEHQYCTNQILEDFNMAVLKKINAFGQGEFVLDYDNTINFNEKQDSKMSYKRAPGYQPGVCTVNQSHVLYLENRNGNSDAKSFQHETLERAFEAIERSGVRMPDCFRADAASYQFEVIKMVEGRVGKFYIGCRNSYVAKYFGKITEWAKAGSEDDMEVGSITFRPFLKQSKGKEEVKEYRLVVKRKPNDDGQLDLFTQDAFTYRAIITNDFEKSHKEVAAYYNQRGGMERVFDTLKNDFGWNKMPFSSLAKNHVFLWLAAICSNLYKETIKHFSKKHKSLAPNFRIKKFIFRFVILPAKWIMQGRQLKLRVFDGLGCQT